MQYFGEDRLCSVSRELTKKFEENKRGTLKEVHDYFAAKTVKGEIVMVVAGKE
jgi:16S rRNA (cytidine1402-2'-O)-methyltransferase